ncbi:MAG: hypothetical protein NVS3B16_05140 [Vulcanimicrobiaceae bacterium]
MVAGSVSSEDGFFRALAENVPDIVFTTAPGGDIEYFNNRWYRYTGQTAAQALDGGYFACIHPDDLALLASAWATVRASGDEGTADARYRRHDGAYRWHRVTVAPYRDAEGRIVRWLGTISDIHAERSAERSFRTLAESVQTLVWAARPDGCVDYYNVRWHERVADIDAMLGNGWKTFVHPDDLEQAVRAWTHSVGSGEDCAVRLRFRMRGGDYRWHESTATAERDEAGQIVRWYGTSVDINESVILREELRDQDVVTRLLRELARRTPSLLFSTTADGRIDFINERWSDVIGVDADMMLGFGWTRFLHASDVTTVGDAFAEHMLTGEAFVAQCRLKRSDAAYRWIEIRAEAQRDEAGRIVRWYGAGTDIDTQRRAIEALDLLAASGASAATASDTDTTLSLIARASLAGVADVSMFDLIEPSGATRRIVVTAPSVPDATYEAIRAYAPPLEDGAHPVTRAIAERVSVHIPVVDEAFLAAHIAPAERRATWRETGVRSVIVAPLIVGDTSLGALTLLRTLTDVAFDRQDVRVVEEIARRTAVAVDNIRLRELTRAEAAERDDRFRQIADSIPQLMWVADAQGTVEWVNQRWLEFSGQSALAALADGWRTVIHPDDEERANAQWRAAAERGASFECDFRLRGGDGLYRWFLGRATPVRTAAGEKWYGTNTDIDDARRASRTLRAFADVGEALSESLGLQATLDAVMRVAVPAYADWAFITLCDESNDLFVAAVYHEDPSKSEPLATQIGKLYARGHHATGSPAAVRAREPLLYQNATYADAARVVELGVLDVFWLVVGFHCVLVVPLVVGSVARGALTLCMSQSRRTFDPADVPFFAELGRRIAPAVANAELYERERRVAQSFQEAALPATLPAADGYVFSAIYEAGRGAPARRRRLVRRLQTPRRPHRGLDRRCRGLRFACGRNDGEHPSGHPRRGARARRPGTDARSCGSCIAHRKPRLVCDRVRRRYRPRRGNDEL